MNLIDQKTNGEIAYVKDKSNGGSFYSIMCPYIQNDTHLYEIIEDKDPKYKIEFSNNNWFEVIRYGIYGFIDRVYVSDCCNIFDVLAETVETMWYDSKKK